MRIKQTARKSTCQTSQSRDPIQNRINNILVTKRHSASPGGSGNNGPCGKAPRSGGKNLAMLRQSHLDSSRVKQKPRSKPGVKALKEIRRLQRTTDLQIPRSAFQRLVREICNDMQKDENRSEPGLGPKRIEGELRFQTAALMALQEAAEAYLVQLFEQSHWCSQHANRATLFVSDLQLVCRIRKSLEVQK